MESSVLKIFLISLYFIVCCKTIKTQTSQEVINDFNLIIHAKDIEIDELQNLYVVTVENEILRFDKSLNLLYRYSNERLGDVTKIDISNPHKILIFYKEYGIVKSLDNTLTETHQIDLNDLNFWDVEAIGMSQDNNLWLYDPIAFKLKKINEQGEVILESFNLMDELNQTIEPLIVCERNGHLIVVDLEKGIFLFDNFANFLRFNPIQLSDAKFDIYSVKDLFILEDKSLNRIDLTTGASLGMDFFLQDLSELIDFEVYQQKIFLLYKNGILIERFD